MIVLAPTPTSPLPKRGSTLKGKNLLPLGSKFLPFKVDPFSEGGW